MLERRGEGGRADFQISDKVMNFFSSDVVRTIKFLSQVMIIRAAILIGFLQVGAFRILKWASEQSIVQTNGLSLGGQAHPPLLL